MIKNLAFLDLRLGLYSKILFFAVRGADTLVMIDIILASYLKPRRLGLYKGRKISYDSEDKIFIFKEVNSNKNYRVDYPLQIPYTPNTSIQEFEIYLFKRNQTIENKILQVYLKQGDKKERIGWIFPINSLVSTEHDFVNNDHFLNYAKAAFIELKIQKLDSDSLLDSYDNNTHIFCHSKERAKTLNITFDITQYFHYFYLYGYHDENNREIKIDIKYPDQEITLQEYSDKIVNIEYIRKIFNEILPYTNEPLLEFFYQYQLIELLIDQVFSYTKQIVITKLSEQDLTASEVRDRLYDLQKVLSEKERIKKLTKDFTDFLKIDEKDNLKQYCNDFLKIKNNLVDCDLDNFEEYLYKLRNSLFHNHFKIRDYQGLDKINESFRICLVNMITSYKEPP